MDQPAPLDEQNYFFWRAEDGQCIEVGPDCDPFLLPDLDIPIVRTADRQDSPSADTIGNSIYDYLRQFPDCPHNKEYAGILRDAFPHFLADLASQTIMLDSKDVEAPYLRRKINGLKILALLEEKNAGLHQLIGIAWYDLAMEFRELPNCLAHLSAALRSLEISGRLNPEDAKTWNYLGQVNFLMGDYPVAADCYEKAIKLLPAEAAREQLEARAASLRAGEGPDQPLVNGLEAIGAALIDCGKRAWGDALGKLQQLDARGFLTDTFPHAEVLVLLARCQANCNDAGLAIDTLQRALAIDPDCESALDGRRRLLSGEDWS